jgi:23S rRNA (uracil1939-C5)-methyltransferase
MILAALDRGWRQTQGLKRMTSETRDLFRQPAAP